MPQLNKGGKFVFGLSVIHPDLTIHIPPQALSEYDAARNGKVIIFTMGAKGPLLEKAHNFQGDIAKY